MRKFLILITIASVGGLSGCAAFNTIRTDRHTTIGQEMLDLKKAKEAGIITESQYNEQITRLMSDKNTIKVDAKLVE